MKFRWVGTGGREDRCDVHVYIYICVCVLQAKARMRREKRPLGCRWKYQTTSTADSERKGIGKERIKNDSTQPTQHTIC